MDFLEKKEKISRKAVEKKVLIVTSHKDHKRSVIELKNVDDKDNSVEWIVSVSMLTEGWDVKNIFQIVPWEDRAFNSKLLIAQVLGRGLRIPEEYKSPQPKVRVFNHDAWSRNIRGLVDEILEIEMRLTSEVLKIEEQAKYHFDLYTINYDKQEKIVEAKKNTKVFDYSKGYIDLVSQIEQKQETTEYENLSGAGFVKDTIIEYNTYSIDEVADKIMNEFSIRDWEAKILKLPGGEYKNQIPPREEIRSIIENSLKRRGIKSGRIREDNKQRILQAFGTLLRKRGKTIVFKSKVSKLVKINTKSLEKESIAVGNIKRGATVFYFDNFEQECNPEQTEILKDLIQENQKLSRGEQYVLVEVKHHIFKTPVDKVLTNKTPEEKFVDLLISDKVYQKINAWIKSRDVGFYSIEYSWRKGEHPTQNNFNPDFFLKIGNNIVVVEIKSDGDDSDENKAKYKWAKEHFKDLNRELKKEGIKQKYFFHFLSPGSYAEFAEYLITGKLFKGEFKSTIEELLGKSNL